MKKLLLGITLILLASLLIGSSTGGFVDEQSVWNDPNWTARAEVFTCTYCDGFPFSFGDYLNPKLPVEPMVEPEKPVPVVLPDPLPYTKGDIASLFDSLSTKPVPSQTFGKHVFYF